MFKKGDTVLVVFKQTANNVGSVVGQIVAEDSSKMILEARTIIDKPGLEVGKLTRVDQFLVFADNVAYIGKTKEVIDNNPKVPETPEVSEESELKEIEVEKPIGKLEKIQKYLEENPDVLDKLEENKG